jgi:hypothetical protein
MIFERLQYFVLCSSSGSGILNSKLYTIDLEPYILNPNTSP